MDNVVLVATIASLALLNLVTIALGVFERREQRRHLERLERIVASRSLAEAAAAEDLYAKALKSGGRGELEPERKPEPGQMDQFWGTTPTKQGR